MNYFFGRIYGSCTLALVFMAMSPTAVASTMCNELYGITQFENGSQHVTLEVANNQAYASFEQGMGGKSDPKHRFAVCLAPRLVVVTDNSVELRPLSAGDALPVAPDAPADVTTTHLFTTTEQQIWLLSFSEPAVVGGIISAVMHQLANTTGVLSVQPDILVDVQQTELVSSSYSAPLLEQYHPQIQTFWQYSQGDGVRIAVIDDGFNLQHRDFVGANIEPGRLSMAVQGNFHGTRVAGLIFAQHNHLDINGIAPDATLIPVPITASFTSSLIRTLHDTYQQHPDIINISWYLPWLMAPIKETIQFIAQQGRHGRGIAIFAASGNRDYSETSDFSLAGMREVLTVGAFNIRRERPTRAYGGYIDIAAQVGFASLSDDKKTASRLHGFIGSSAATPYLSGISALVLSLCPKLTRAQLYQLLITSTEPPPEKFKANLGAGMLNLDILWRNLNHQCQADFFDKNQ